MINKNMSKVAKLLKNKKVLLIVISALLLLATVGGTVAYVIITREPITNTFVPAKVSCEVTESFNGTVKSDVNVINTSDVDAWLRVKLVTYRVNSDGQHIGGSAVVPTFTPGDGWILHKGFYYYTRPVASGATPAVDLIDSITLSTYSDVDGGFQAVDVIAEAIQADGVDENGKKVVEQVWGVDPQALGR